MKRSASRVPACWIACGSRRSPRSCGGRSDTRAARAAPSPCRSPSGRARRGAPRRWSSRPGLRRRARSSRRGGAYPARSAATSCRLCRAPLRRSRRCGSVVAACVAVLMVVAAAVVRRRSAAARCVRAGSAPRLVRVVARARHARLRRRRRPESPGRLYVVEQQGTIRVVERGKVSAAPFLDVRSRDRRRRRAGPARARVPEATTRSTRTFYVNYTATAPAATVIDRYRVRSGRALPASRRADPDASPQPYANHNGGHLAFGPDGKLWVGLGDGGSGGDPENRAQDRSTLLGKMFRLDVAKRIAEPRARRRRASEPVAVHFDRRTGDLWIGDVGQNEIEEVDVPAAAVRRARQLRLGRLRGPARVRGQGARAGPARPAGRRSTATTAAARSRGGYVYRGSAVAEPSRPLRLRRLLQRHDLEHPGRRRRAAGRAGEGRGLISFGEDLKGELYAVSHGGTIYRFAR